MQRALRAFDKLETLADLAMVDEDAPAYDEAFHDRIFVAEEVDTLLQEDGTGDFACSMRFQSMQCIIPWVCEKPMCMLHCKTVEVLETA